MHSDRPTIIDQLARGPVRHLGRAARALALLAVAACGAAPVDSADVTSAADTAVSQCERMPNDDNAVCSGEAAFSCRTQYALTPVDGGVPIDTVETIPPEACALVATAVRPEAYSFWSCCPVKP